MLEGGKVTNRQASLFLMTIVVIATAILFAPTISSTAAKQNAWISMLAVATPYGLTVVLLIIKLGLRFPEKTVIEYAPLILGAWLGKLVGAGFVFGFIHFDAIMVREFGDLLLTAFMPETPLLVFNLMLLFLAAWAAKEGLEVICRSGEWVFPLYIASLLLIFVLAASEADFSNLLPVLEDGIRPVVRGGLAPAGFRGEIVIMLMLLPYLNQPEKAGKYLGTAVVLLGVLLAMLSALLTAVMGGLSQNLVFPIISLTRYISVAGFIERVEALILVMWVAGVTIKVAAFYYVAVLAAAQLFGLRDYKPLVLPVGAVMAVWSQSLFENDMQLLAWLSTIFPPYAFTFELVIPSLLLLVAVLRKKGGTRDTA